MKIFLPDPDAQRYLPTSIVADGCQAHFPKYCFDLRFHLCYLICFRQRPDLKPRGSQAAPNGPFFNRKIRWPVLGGAA